MPTDTSVFIDTFGSAFGVNWIIEYLRTAPGFRWLPIDTSPLLMLVIKLIAAACLATGIHYKWAEPGAVPAGYQYAVTILIPSLSTIQHGLWMWFVQAAWMGISDAVLTTATRGRPLAPNAQLKG